MVFWDTILLLANFAVLLPMVIWSVECAAALLPPRKRIPWIRRPRVTILVPAHNEAKSIGAMLQTLNPELQSGDRAIVIADNCTDQTARVASEFGATVLERVDPLRPGKSRAIDFALHSVAHDIEGVVVIIDADCDVHRGAIDHLARLASGTGRPVQANYVLDPPADRSPERHISALAFLIKNFVRPSGLDRLGFPCFLNGSGMAFPTTTMRKEMLGSVWERSAPITAGASGRTAEDKWITIDFALAGHLPLFCADATITSHIPEQSRDAAVQRAQWLQGHLECMFRQGLPLLRYAIRHGQSGAYGLLLDFCVPPLSLLAILWCVVLGADLAALLRGASRLPLIIAAAAAGMMALTFAGVVLKFGHPGAARSLLRGPFYVLAKLPVYVSFFFRRRKKWVPPRSSNP